jgi:hypothetical protein
MPDSEPAAYDGTIDQVLTYHKLEQAIDVGQYRGETICVFGYYRVELCEAGFVYMSPHTGFVGTVSEWPIDVESDPDFRALLIASARDALAQHDAGRMVRHAAAGEGLHP